MNIERRGFLSGIIALAAAPAIVRVASLMPIKPLFIDRAHPFLAQAAMDWRVIHDLTEQSLEDALVQIRAWPYSILDRPQLIKAQQDHNAHVRAHLDGMALLGIKGA